MMDKHRKRYLKIKAKLNHDVILPKSSLPIETLNGDKFVSFSFVFIAHVPVVAIGFLFSSVREVFLLMQFEERAIIFCVFIIWLLLIQRVAELLFSRQIKGKENTNQIHRRRW